MLRLFRLKTHSVCVDLRVLAYMYNTAKKQVWYGELRTSKGNAIVVHDNQPPDTSQDVSTYTI